MRSARDRALTQISFGSSSPHARRQVEMRSARDRALTQTIENADVAEEQGRNEVRPRQGIDTTL